LKGGSEDGAVGRRSSVVVELEGGERGGEVEWIDEVVVPLIQSRRDLYGTKGDGMPCVRGDVSVGISRNRT